MSNPQQQRAPFSTNFTEMSQEMANGKGYIDGWGNTMSQNFQEGANSIGNNSSHSRSSAPFLTLHRTQSAQSSYSQQNNFGSGQNQGNSSILSSNVPTSSTPSRPRSEAFFQHPQTNIRSKALPFVEGEQQEELGRKFGVGTLWPVQDAIYKGYQRRASPSPIGERPQAISAPIVPLSPTLFPWNTPELPPKQVEGNNLLNPTSSSFSLRNGHHREAHISTRMRPHTFGEETAKNTSYSLFGNQGNHPLDSLPTRDDRSNSSVSSGSMDSDLDSIDSRSNSTKRYPPRSDLSPSDPSLGMHRGMVGSEENEAIGGYASYSNTFGQSYLLDANNGNGMMMNDGEAIARAPSADSTGSGGSFSPTAGFDNAASYGEHPLGEHPSRTLFVRNINSNVEDEELTALFEAHGHIRSMYTQCKHRGFVMISYYDIRHAKNAMRHLQGKPLRRRKLDIHYSIPKDNPSEKDQNQGTLVVFNLDPSTTNEELKIIFGSLGEIKEIRETPNKKHHKFIEFYDVRDAEKAMKHLNKTEVKGKKIKIEPSRPGGARKTNSSGQTDYFPSSSEDDFNSLLNSSNINPSSYMDNATDYPLNESENSNYFQHFATSVAPIFSSSSVSPRYPPAPISSLPPSSALSAPFNPSAATLNAMANSNSFPSLQSAYPVPNSSAANGVQITFTPSATNTLSSSLAESRPRGSSSGNIPPPVTSIWISPDPLRAPSTSAPPYRQLSVSPVVQNESNSVTIPSSNSVSSNLTESSLPFKSSLDKDGKPNRARAESLEDRSRYSLNPSKVRTTEDTRTTLMIRNIPNKYTQKMLLQAVDEHHKGCYDFFYLPIDFKNKCNVGYAFINFTSPSHIISFHDEFNNKKWEKFNSEKVCELTYARIQGKIALIGHFQNSSLMCEDKKCRPIIFNSGEQEPFPVGNSVKRRAMSVGGKDDEALLRQLNLNA